MKIEPLEKKDIPHLLKLQPEGWSDIIPSIQYYLDHSFCLPIKICLDQDIIGIGAGILFKKTAWLAHIIVDTEFRGQGIGQKIVLALLDLLKKRNCESISLIATALGYPVYKKLEFIEQTDYIFFERKMPFKPQARSEHIFSYTREQMKEILFLDQQISGEDRSNVLMDRLKNSHVYQKNGKVTGCYLPDLDEGMIIANEIKAGIELMKIKYAVKEKAILPFENTAGIHFLEENGFIETLRAKRMVWGRQFLWHPDKLYSRISGRLG